MKQGTTEKTKFKKLKRRLRMPEWQVIGLLESIWRLTATDTPDGAIGRLANEDIAASIEYDDDPDALIRNLIDCRWLDEHSSHRLVVHDWVDHAPNYIKGNLKRHGRSFAEPAKEPAKDGATKSSQAQPSPVNSSKANSSLTADDCLSVEIPRSLNVREFRDAWQEWVEYKQASPHAWKSDRGPKAQLTRLSKHDRDAVIAGIYAAISQEWSGIHPERITARSDGRAPHQVPEPQRPPTITGDVARYRLIKVHGRPEARDWSDQQCIDEYRKHIVKSVVA